MPVAIKRNKRVRELSVMKAEIRKKVCWCLWGLLPLALLLSAVNPKAAVLMVFGCKYSSCGIIAVTDGKNFSENAVKQEVHIYQASKKPYVLVGPYTFFPGYRDFFFVNKNQVIRTATDKGGGEFFQLGTWLFVIDDMSGSDYNRVRTSWWDELQDKASSVEKKNGQYVYTIYLKDAEKSVTFAVPEKILDRCLE